MPKQGTRAEVNTFVKGLITEASPLNFPANASLDEVNFELKRDGTRRRRQGMAFEPGSVMNTATGTTANSVVNSYVWTGANGDYSLEFLVVQVGTSLEFLDMTKGSVSPYKLAELVLPLPSNVRYSFASVNGLLIVAGGATNVYQIEYSNGAFVSKARILKVRDVWGVQEQTSDMEEDYTIRPTVLTGSHHYNLQNQSWGIPRKNKLGALVDPVAYYFQDLAKYPSSTETVWNGLQFQPVEAKETQTLGKSFSTFTGSSTSAGSASATTTVDPTTGNYVTTTSVAPGGAGSVTTSTTEYDPPTLETEYKDPYERMFNSLYEDRLGADLNAAKGYYIIELLNRGTSRLSMTQKNNAKYPLISAGSSYKQDYNTSGPTVVCGFAGRMFYSGFDGKVVDGDSRSPSLEDYVVFSKLVQNDVDLDLCYQEGDPTSRESNDVVDTDGGFISISGAKNIVAMHNLGSKLIVFASNGVWAISGGSDYGFTATNYKVDKLSSFGCVSAESVVNEGSDLLFWGKNAIYAVTPDKVGGYLVDDITAGSIQTFYDNIPYSQKLTSKGVYDPVGKKMRWIYKSAGFFSGSGCKELVFDTVLKAFYRYDINTTYVYDVASIFCSERMDTPVKYLAVRQGSGIQFTVAYYRDTTFQDWGTVDAKAYLLTGAITANDSAIDKQVPYVTVHMKRTETGTDSNGVPLNQSSCSMSGRWEWANSVASHKISSLYEVYKYRMPLFSLPNSTFDNGFETVISKNKVRGRGKAISLYFETSPGKDCVLLGWSITINGNGVT